ncbi:MAG TPA: sigma-70 family RNA polymerase sigma factor [Gammaproteobacteria bacterium]|nr:sigma-70 family RNA polymerase sigma factor [Gammaproteobacteria bacterium]
MEEDAALLAAIADGSERAFNVFVDRHQRAVRVFLRGLAPRSDADDIAQETFLAIWSRADRYRGAASVRSWLFAIAWRKAKDSHRRSFRRLGREAVHHDIHAVASDSVSLDERITLEQAMMSLSLAERAAVLLCLAGGFSHSEAAASLDMPLGTIKSHVSRGRERLKAVLESHK